MGKYLIIGILGPLGFGYESTLGPQALFFHLFLQQLFFEPLARAKAQKGHHGLGPRLWGLGLRFLGFCTFLCRMCCSTFYKLSLRVLAHGRSGLRLTSFRHSEPSSRPPASKNHISRTCSHEKHEQATRNKRIPMMIPKNYSDQQLSVNRFSP